MNEQEIRSRLWEIFAEIFGAEEARAITDASQAKDVKGWDSLSHIELLARIEEAFHLKLIYREIVSFGHVGDIVACLVQKCRS